MNFNKLLFILTTVVSILPCSLSAMRAQVRDLKLVNNDPTWRLLVTYTMGPKQFRRVLEANKDSLFIEPIDQISKITVNRFNELIGAGSFAREVTVLDQVKQNQREHAVITVSPTWTGWAFDLSWTPRHEIPLIPQNVFDAFPGMQATKGHKEDTVIRSSHILGIPADASLAEMEAAYNELTKRWNPENYSARNDKEMVWKIRGQLNEAYASLRSSIVQIKFLDELDDSINRFKSDLQFKIISQLLKGNRPPLPPVTTIKNNLQNLHNELQQMIASNMKPLRKKEILNIVLSKVEEQFEDIRAIAMKFLRLLKTSQPDLYNELKADYLRDFTKSNLPADFLRAIGLWVSADNQPNIYEIYQFLGVDPQTARSLDLDQIRDRIDRKKAELLQSFADRQENIERVLFLFRQINWVFSTTEDKTLYDAFIQGKQALEQMKMTPAIAENMHAIYKTLLSGEENTVQFWLENLRGFCKKNLKGLS